MRNNTAMSGEKCKHESQHSANSSTCPQTTHRQRDSDDTLVKMSKLTMAHWMTEWEEEKEEKDERGLNKDYDH